MTQEAQATALRGCLAGKPIDPALLASYERLFWKNVDRRDAADCWNWTANLSNGYGQVNYRYQGRQHGLTAHRVSYSLLVGPIPAGMTIDHLCRNRACVNPAHLEVVTARENVQRGSSGSATHCKRGHEFTPDNLLPTGDGHRKCKTCNRARQRDYYLRRKARESLAA